VYSGVEIVTHDGQLCLTPIGEIQNFKLDQLVSQWNDLNGNGVKDVGDTITYTIPDVQTMGFVYINMHLDFDLEKRTGYIKGNETDPNVTGNGLGEDALDNPNVAGAQPQIVEGSNFEFSAAVNGAALADSSDTIVNENVWKNIKGMGGLFQINFSNTEGLDEIALQGQHLIIKTASGTVVGDAYTDADGWYYAQFMATGKKTGYKVYWDQNNDGKITGNEVNLVKQTDMGGAAGKWAEVNLTVIDPVGYLPDQGDVRVDSHGGLMP
jgi:hypothetical protein